MKNKKIKIKMQKVKDYSENAIFKIEIKMLSGKLFVLGTYHENCKVSDIAYFLRDTEFVDMTVGNIVFVRNGDDILLPPYYIVTSDLELNLIIRNIHPELYEFCRDPQNILRLSEEVSYLLSLNEPITILEDFIEGWNEYVLSEDVPDNIDELRQIAITVLTKYGMSYLIDSLYREEIEDDYPTLEQFNVHNLI